MCTYMYICIHTCINSFAAQCHVYIYKNMYTYIYTSMFTYMYICVHIYINSFAEQCSFTVSPITFD